MSFASKVLYTGDGVTKSFNVPMPYLSKTHVNVYVNEILQLNTMHYVWSNTSTILFNDPPGIDSAIEIKRWTSPGNTLVDFEDGSTLRAADLDTAYLHNYYLSQEYADSFNELINETLINIASGAGIVETETDAVIAALVNEMLNTAQASELRQRVDDIDTNAEAIITLGESLQVQINTLSNQLAADVFIQPDEPIPGVGGVPDPIAEGSRWYDTDDNNHPYIYTSGAWVSIEDPRIGVAQADISVLNVQMLEQNAAIVDERFVRANQFSAFSQRLGLIGSENASQSAFIIDLDTTQVDETTGETLGQRFSLLTTNDANNAADIVTEQTARISGDNANAADITALDVRLTTAEGDIVGNSSAVSVLQTDVGTNTADILTAQGNISTNASAITALESDIDLRSTVFHQSLAPTANNPGDIWFDTDDGKIYIWNGSSWVESENATIGANATAITGLTTQVDVLDGTVSSHTSSITTLNSQVSTLDGEMNTAQVDIVANTSAISTAEGDILTLEAKYGVTLDVNDYITGFAQHNDGKTGSFVILADKFAIADPGNPDLQPFIVSGNKIVMNGDVSINGNLLLNGSVVGAALVAGTIGSTQIGTNAISTTHISANAITATEIAANAVTAGKINVTTLAAIEADLGAITAGTIQLNNAGWIKGGQTAYNTGTGYFLGYESGYKFSIGSPTGDRLTWDGSLLTIVGDVKVGEYIKDTSETVATANTERTKSGTGRTKKKEFQVDRDGDVYLYYDYRCPNASYTNAQFYTYKNGTSLVDALSTGSVANYTSRQVTLNGLVEGDKIHVEISGGQWFSDGPEPGTGYIKNAQLRATVTIPGNSTVLLN